ncbi:MAG TPA: autotransporter outer membrane beta-barrel domain-containing protein [Planctomycetes bacterium]|nr:autotransporter outer membrane beta-barrel domain-containing protein [Planctomycetota bacterium]
MIATAAALTSTATVIDTGGYDFSLSVDGGTDLLLTWEEAQSILDMLVNANANQRAIAIYLDTLNAKGPNAALQALFDALLDLGETELVAALNQLLPELYSDAQVSTLYASQGFANNLLSCKVNGPGTASIIAEGQCLWAGASATFLSQDTTFNQLGFNETTGSFAAGVQVALDDNWRLGFGAGYQSTSVDTVTNATSEGNTGQVGVALKYNVGSALVAGTISGGRAWYDTTRPVAFTGFSGTAESDSTIDFLNGGLRFAYVFGSPQLYFKPVLDAAVTRIDLGGFTETGGGAANLTVAGSKQTVYTIAPSLETGTEWWLGNGTLIRPFLRGGVTFYEGNDFALNAGFAGAPAGISPFTINTDTDDVMGVVGVGIDMITAQETVLHVTYDGQFGETTSIQAVALKGSVRY